MQSRTIPKTGETLPVIGLGTYRAFDITASDPRYSALGEVLDVLLASPSSVIDSSPMYGRAEEATGALLAERDRRPKAFLATKVWTRGRKAGLAQIEQSFALLKAERIDLMQVHNLVDYTAHLETIADLKDAGRVRYSGLTHYHSGAFAELESAMRNTGIDFVQLNYSLEDRTAEERLLPLAEELGIGVIVNVPFGGGALLRTVSKLPLPGFADALGAPSWAQLLLKFVLGHPAVTCAIPGTGDPGHMIDNIKAADGDLEEARDQILRWWRSR